MEAPCPRWGFHPNCTCPRRHTSSLRPRRGPPLLPHRALHHPLHTERPPPLRLCCTRHCMPPESHRGPSQGSLYCSLQRSGRSGRSHSHHKGLFLHNHNRSLPRSADCCSDLALQRRRSSQRDWTENKNIVGLFRHLNTFKQVIYALKVHTVYKHSECLTHNFWINILNYYRALYAQCTLFASWTMVIINGDKHWENKRTRSSRKYREYKNERPIKRKNKRSGIQKYNKQGTILILHDEWGY